jgi:hypothetical protein
VQVEAAGGRGTYPTPTRRLSPCRVLRSMTSIQPPVTVRNRVESPRLYTTLDLLRENPVVGRFQVRTRTPLRRFAEVRT